MLKTLTQIFVVIHNFTDLIQVKFPWELWAQGQEQEVVRGTWGHRGPRKDRQGERGSVPEKEEDMQKACLMVGGVSEDKGQPFHTQNLWAYSASGRGALKARETPENTDSAAVEGADSPAQTSLSKYTPDTTARFFITLMRSFIPNKGKSPFCIR